MFSGVDGMFYFILFLFVLIAVAVCFIFFDFPYRVCLFFFRGKSVGAGMVQPFKRKIIWLYRDGHIPSDFIMKHEERHLAQIEENGVVKFVLLYLIYLLRYGYYNNPFEVDARSVE